MLSIKIIMYNAEHVTLHVIYKIGAVCIIPDVGKIITLNQSD